MIAKKKRGGIIKELDGHLYYFMKKSFIFFVVCIVFTFFPFWIDKEGKDSYFYWYLPCLWILFIVTICYYYSLVFNYKQKKSIYRYKIHKQKKLFQIDTTNIWTDSVDEYTDLIQSLLKTLSSQSREKFNEMGFNLVIAKRENVDRFYRSMHKGTMGFFSMNKRVLFVCKDFGIDDVRKSFYHEWGHFLDLGNLAISRSMIFKEFYYKKIKEKVNEIYEGKKLKKELYKRGIVQNKFIIFLKVLFWNEYKYSSSEEFLAESYAEYKDGKISKNSLKDFFIFFENNQFDFMEKWLQENMKQKV